MIIVLFRIELLQEITVEEITKRIDERFVPFEQPKCNATM